MGTDSLIIADQVWWNVTFHPFTGGILVALFIIILLLISSALISGSEVAYFSLGPAERQKIAKNKANQRILRNLENPEKLLATILVANNFVNVGIVIISAWVTSNLIDFSNSPTFEFIIQVIVITFILVLFGEIIPKVFATHYSLQFARFMAFPLAVLSKIFNPVNLLLISSTSFVNRRLKKNQKNISMNEISQALELTSKNEISDEKDILEGIVKFGNKNVSEIMHPRVDVVALDIKSTYDKVLEIINNSGYSRMPVYSATFDNIKGILYIKDLLAYAEKGPNFYWQKLLRPSFFVPETKKIKALLEDFQKYHVHMAVVVDEYGGSSGIVTLEDVLEEIVGDISDEFDEEENFYTKIAENKFLFDGKTSLSDFYEVVECPETFFDDVKGDADTLAGLILEIRGEIPPKNEKIEYRNFRFTIDSVTSRMIKQIKVEVL